MIFLNGKHLPGISNKKEIGFEDGRFALETTVSMLLIWFLNILAIEITSLAVMDDGYDDKEGGHTYGML